MIVKATEDMYNAGKCFTEGEEYEVLGYYEGSHAGLIDRHLVNDLGERHRIGMWYRNFEIVTN